MLAIACKWQNASNPTGHSHALPVDVAGTLGCSVLANL
jgi:hypothetical protein